MMPATWVPWPLPRSVFWYGPVSVATTIVLLASGGTLTYSALYSFTLWTTWSARSGWLASQPLSTTRDRHALAGEAGGAQRGRAHGVGRGGVEQLDRLVGVDVVGDAAGDGALHGADPAGHRASGTLCIGWTASPSASRAARSTAVGTASNVAMPRTSAAPS